MAKICPFPAGHALPRKGQLYRKPLADRYWEQVFTSASSPPKRLTSAYSQRGYMKELPHTTEVNVYLLCFFCIFLYFSQ